MITGAVVYWLKKAMGKHAESLIELFSERFPAPLQCLCSTKMLDLQRLRKQSSDRFVMKVLLKSNNVKTSQTVACDGRKVPNMNTIQFQNYSVG